MPIDPKRVQATFLAAVEQADRAAILDRECGDDPELRRRVEALLKANDEPASYLDQPPVELANPAGTIDYAPVAEKPGSMIGPYKLKEQIGEGGFGLVFVAEQQEPVKRKVALKVIKPGMDTREVMARFAAERQALALMDHPNIARVLDAGATDSGRPYFVMELVRGIPITEYCDQNQLAPRDRLELFVTVCQAVQHAHQKGVIHRDIKPSNVLVTSHDGKPVAKVIDFGVAKAINQQLTDRSIYTQFTQMIGTPLYMSPEQAEMSGLDIDTRSDIYSLGVLLYELLTGTTPFDKKRFAKAAYDEIRRLIREEEPPKPSTRLSTSDSIASIAAQRHTEPAKLSKLVRGDLDWITMKALEKDRTRRYETANGLARDIERYLSDEPVEACPPSATYRLRKFARRHKPQATAAVLVFLALLAGIVGTTYGLFRADQQRLVAEQARVNEQRRAEGERRAKLDAVEKQSEAEKQQHRAEAGEKLADQRLVQVDAERKKAEAAAAEKTITLADAHTSLGLIASEQNKPYESLLWFASAANLAHGDPQRELANRTRFATWARGLAYPIAVMPHPGQEVTRIVFHPSELYLLTFAGNGYTLYDVRTARAAELPIASRGQGCAEWSPNGELLALGGNWGTVDIYSFPECRLLHALRHPGVIRALSFSDDGAYLAIGSNLVRVWSTAKQHFLVGELLHPQAVLGVDFDASSRRLVTSCLDNKARVFAIGDERLDARPLFPPVGHSVGTGKLFLATGFCATFVKNGGLLVNKDYHTLRLLDAETGAEIRHFVPAREYVTTVRVSPDRRSFIMCGKRTCQLFDAAQLGGAGVSLEEPQGVCDAAFHPAGKIFVTAGINNRAEFWSVPGSEPLGAALPHQSRVGQVAYSPSGQLLATVQEGGLVRVWQIPPPVKTLHFPASSLSGSFFRLVLSSDGRFALATRSWPGARGPVPGSPSIQVYETAAGGAIGLPLRADARVNGADFSPDGTRVIAAVAPSPNRRGEIVIWKWRDGNQCFPPIPTPSEPADVSYSPRGDYAVAVCVNGEVLIIDPNTAQVRKCANHGASVLDWWKYPKRWVVFSPDGSRFATPGLGNIVRIWTPTGEPTGSVQHQDAVTQAVFSPNGNYLATASRDSTARIFTVPSGEELARLSHPACVSAVRFSPDQKQLLTACTDSMARLWDWEKERLVCPGFEHKDEVCDASFLPNGPWILTLGRDSTVRGWESRTGKAVMPPIKLTSGFGSDLHDLMIAADGRYLAAPGTGKFELCNIADAGLVGPQEIDLASLRSLAELYSGRRIVASGTIRLTADEWLDRWKSLLASSSGSAAVEANSRGLGSFADVFQRLSAAKLVADARSKATAARRLALIGTPLELDGTAIDGKPFDWGAYRGKVTLVNFCTHYAAESESLLAALPLYTLYHDVGFEVVGVNLDDDRAVIDRFVARMEVPWSTLRRAAAGTGRLVEECGIAESPMSLLMDRDGKVISQDDVPDVLAARLRKLLGPPFRGPLICLDLQSRANWNMNEEYWVGNLGTANLAMLPRGERDFAGVKFNVGAFGLRLGGKLQRQPVRIDSISVNAIASKLYFLHATGWGTGDGTLIGEYLIHYADGNVRSIPILNGRDVDDWRANGLVGKGPATRSLIAWQVQPKERAPFRLFMSVWKNPRPAVNIESLDYVSKMTDAAPFCVAITAEGPVAAKPTAKANR